MLLSKVRGGRHFILHLSDWGQASEKPRADLNPKLQTLYRYLACTLNPAPLCDHET